LRSGWALKKKITAIRASGGANAAARRIALMLAGGPRTRRLP
jgi:hypothetical protein